MSDFLGWTVVPVIAVVIALIIIISNTKQPAPAEAAPAPRMKIESVGSFDISLYIITDTITGRQYLATYQGGIIELPKPESK